MSATNNKIHIKNYSLLREDLLKMIDQTNWGFKMRNLTMRTVKIIEADSYGDPGYRCWAFIVCGSPVKIIGFVVPSLIGDNLIHGFYLASQFKRKFYFNSNFEKISKDKYLNERDWRSIHYNKRASGTVLSVP